MSVVFIAPYFTDSTNEAILSLIPSDLFHPRISPTVWMNEMPRFYVGKLFLHHYKSDLAHLSDLYSTMTKLYKYER